MSSVHIGQINLQKSKVASVELNKRNYVITLITEPYNYKNNVAALDKRVADVFYALKTNPRAALRCSPDLKPWLVSEFTGRDICTIAVKIEGTQTYVSSVYLDITIPTRNQKMVDMIDRCENEGIALILGMDSNSHSVLWGCQESNTRGVEMEDLIAEKNLRVVNVGITPTFKTCRAESIIDVTLMNSTAMSKLEVEEWRVVKDPPSFSDHRYIEFRVGKYTPKQRSYRNLNKTDWGEFQKIVATEVKNWEELQPDGPGSDDLDGAADRLQKVIQDAMDVACPPKAATLVRPNSWWNKELDRLRKELRKLYNVRYNNQCKNALYKGKLTLYRQAIARAKKISWRAFCSKAETTKEVSSIMKMLKTNSLKGIGLMKKGGRSVNTPEESLDILMDAHFPESVSAEGWEEEAATKGKIQADNDEVVDYVTAEKVKIALASFGPRRAAGPDTFRPIVLQHLPSEVIKYLTDIYKSVLRSGYTPKAWRKMSVIFLPKPEKEDYGVPKAYRPITLSNFLLKCLERIVQWYINENVLTNPLYAQHAYTAGRSTETALTEALDQVERATSNGEHALAVSLDCSGAFDCINFSSAKIAMRLKKVNTTIIKWYDKLLKGRRISAELQGVKTDRIPAKGSPQGGVLSPTVWNLIMDMLLKHFKGGAVKVTAYADDILLIVTGKDPSTLRNLMQTALDYVLKWGRVNGLVFNPEKTCVVDFTKNTRKCVWKKLHMGKKELEYSTSMKYLGVTFTRHLSWTEHVNGRIRKGLQILNMAKAIIGRNWGMDPEKVLWIYTALVRPTISYGALVWAKLLTGTTLRGLKRVQRQALSSMASPLRSTPTEGMESAIGLVPLDLHVEAEVLKARIRTRRPLTETWDGLGKVGGQKGHRRHWDDTQKRLPIKLSK